MEKILELLKQYNIYDAIKEIEKSNLSKADMEKITEIVLNGNGFDDIERLEYAKNYNPEYYKRRTDELLSYYKEGSYRYCAYDLGLYLFENNLDKTNLDMLRRLFVQIIDAEDAQKFKDIFKKNQMYDKLIKYILLKKDPVGLVYLVLYYEPSYLKTLFNTFDNLIDFIAEQPFESFSLMKNKYLLMDIALNSNNKDIVIKVREKIPALHWKTADEYKHYIEKHNLTSFLFEYTDSYHQEEQTRQLEILMLRLNYKIKELT